MLLLKTDSALVNSNLPIYQVSAEERAIAAMNPSTWLEGDSKYLQTDSGGLITAWIDRVSGRRYIPARVEAPQIIGFGTKKAVRFGYQANLTTVSVGVSNNGVLKPEGGWEAATLSGTETYAVLMRLPKPKGQAGSELVAASYGNSGGALLGKSSSADFNRVTASYGTGLLTGWTRSITYLASLDSDYDNQVWHLILVSSNFADNTAVLRINGGQVATNGSAVLTQNPDAGAKQLTIGGSGAAWDQSRLVGDIGAVLYFPDFAAHKNPTELAVIEAYMTAIKLAMA